MKLIGGPVEPVGGPMEFIGGAMKLSGGPVEFICGPMEPVGGAMKLSGGAVEPIAPDTGRKGEGFPLFWIDPLFWSYILYLIQSGAPLQVLSEHCFCICQNESIDTQNSIIYV